jgi:hypothetical protein
MEPLPCDIPIINVSGSGLTRVLDEVLSQEFDKLGRELETDASVRVVVLQSALPDFFITRRSSVSLSDLHEFGAIRRASLAPPVCADHTRQGRQRRLKLRKESLWGT